MVNDLLFISFLDPSLMYLKVSKLCIKCLACWWAEVAELSKRLFNLKSWLSKRILCLQAHIRMLRSGRCRQLANLSFTGFSAALTAVTLTEVNSNSQ